MKTLHIGKTVSRCAALTAELAASFAPSLAGANTAADTTIRNTVYVNYADASAVAQPQISDEVDVLVTLVAATPTLNAPVDQTIAPSSTATYNYTVTSNANGPDTYNLTTPLVESAGLAGSTAAPSSASLLLGATTVATAPGAIAANTPTAITVPSDAASNANLNEIVVGDVVVIGGVRCDVTAVTDSGTTLTGAITNSSVTVDCDAGINPLAGAVIGEQRAFTVLVDPNGFVPPGPETITTTTTARDAANAQPAATDDTITTVEQLLSVIKYVRNVTTPAVPAGPPASVTVAGATYYASGVVGAPGETLEYLVEVTNTSATNSATDTVISDAVPAFTTFDATGFAAITNAQAVTAVTAAEDNDAGEVQGTTVYIYPGSTTHGDDTDGGTGNANGDGGTVAAGEVAYGRFRVIID